MSISNSDAEILRAAGFSEKEIKEVAEAKTPNGDPQPPIDINNDAWLFAIRERRNYINRLIGEGWTQSRIQEELEHYYKISSDRTIFDFLMGYSHLNGELKSDFGKVDYYTGVKNRRARIEKATNVKNYYNQNRGNR